MIVEASTPLRFSTKAEATYAELRRRILSGELEQSAPINQDALARELAVSVTPIREAVRRLEAEGLVQFEAHKTLIVTPLTKKELGEIYDVREQLDPYAAELATVRMTEPDIAELDRRAQAKPSSDPLEQVRINRAFHRAIYAQSGNDQLIEILDRLWEATDRYRVSLVARDAFMVTNARDHAAIVDAVRAREPKRVAELLRAHIQGARALIEDTLE